MSSATNSHNYLYESWTGGASVQSVLMDQHVCRFHVATTAASAAENCTFPHRHLTLAQFTKHLSVKCGGYRICTVQANLKHAAVRVTQDTLTLPKTML